MTGDQIIMRVPMTGGIPAEVLRLVGKNSDFSVRVRGRCILIESTGESLVISSLDPFSGVTER